MSSRRKMPPSPIARARDAEPRSLAPATARVFAIPTAAALMLAIAGCSSAPTGEHIHRDDPKTATTQTATVTATSATAATIGGASMVDPIAPDPQQMDGQMAVVMPTKPVAPKTPTKPAGHIAPITTPKHLGGDVAPTFP